MSAWDVQFRQARIACIHGRPLQHLREGLYTEANGRGVMAAGLSGEVRLAAGPEVERELRLQGPLLVGNAYATGPGKLAQHGLRSIVHGVVIPEPGMTPKRGDSERALTMGLLALEDAGVRFITVSTVGWHIPGATVADAAKLLADSVAARLRRHARFTEVAIVSQHTEYLRACSDRLLRLGGIAGQDDRLEG